MADSDEDVMPFREARPRPPPPPPRSSSKEADPPYATPGNLSNHDFRKMVLETPRRGSGGGGGGGGQSVRRGGGEKTREGHDDPGKKSQHKPWKGKGGSHGQSAAEEDKEDELPKYRDRAKERREDQNPDYRDMDAVAERISVLNAVAPPGSSLLTTGDAHRMAIEQSKFLGGDLEHTHLVKGLDFALLQKVKSEIERKGVGAAEEEREEEQSQTMGQGQPAAAQAKKTSAAFRTTVGKNVYDLLVRPPPSKASEIFLPGRTSFVFDMDDDFRQEIPTTVHRSKADCPPPQDLLSLAVDTTVLDRISHIMNYLRMGSSAKMHKKKKKDKESQVLVSGLVPRGVGGDGSVISGAPKPVPDMGPPPSSKRTTATRKPVVKAAEEEEEDIFADAGKDYVVTGAKKSTSGAANGVKGIFAQGSGIREPVETAMERSAPPLPPEPAPMPPVDQESAPGVAYPPPDYQEYPPPPSADYPHPPSHDYSYSSDALYANPYGIGSAVATNASAGNQGNGHGGMEWMQPSAINQEGESLSSVSRRFDEAEQSARRQGAKDPEKDPAYIDSYAECYPDYKEGYAAEIAGSDEEDERDKMDISVKTKARLHRWDFDTEEEWADYNATKEVLPTEAFQYGVKAVDGRKSKKALKDKDQKLNNELNQINKIIERRRKDRTGTIDDFPEEAYSAKRGRF